MFVVFPSMACDESLVAMIFVVIVIGANVRILATGSGGVVGSRCHAQRHAVPVVCS